MRLILSEVSVDLFAERPYREIRVSLPDKVLENPIYSDETRACPECFESFPSSVWHFL
jgi:hypothetical protein